MRFFSYFSKTKLFVSLLLNRNYNSVTRVLPTKYYSIKTIKQYYYNNNIYYDLYNDFCNCSQECDLNDLNNLTTFSNLKYTKYNNLSAEHIFPQSFTKRYNKANKDMHNIVLTNYYTNNLRSNKKFVDSVNQTAIHNYYSPCNYSRGTIARSLAYMKYSYPLLNLSNVIDNDIITAWNELYPPTELEHKKNNIIFKYQGNKNIFIEDYKKLTAFINNNFDL
jgi:endonuclease I